MLLAAALCLLQAMGLQLQVSAAIQPGLARASRADAGEEAVGAADEGQGRLLPHGGLAPGRAGPLQASSAVVSRAVSSEWLLEVFQALTEHMYQRASKHARIPIPCVNRSHIARMLMRQLPGPGK